MNILQHFLACIKDRFPKKEPEPFIPVLRNREADHLVEAMFALGAGGFSLSEITERSMSFDENLSTEHPLDMLCGEDAGLVNKNIKEFT